MASSPLAGKVADIFLLLLFLVGITVSALLFSELVMRDAKLGDWFITALLSTAAVGIASYSVHEAGKVKK